MEWLMGIFAALTLLLLLLAYHKGWHDRLLHSASVGRAEESLARVGEIILRHWFLAFLVLLALGIFARTYRFCALPGGQNQDGTMAAVEAFCLLRDGVDHWGHSWPTYFEAWGTSQMSTLYSYLLIPFIAVLGLTKFAMRLPMLLISIISLIILFDLVRRALGKGAALITMAVAVTNPWQIMQSRWALEANLMPHVLLIAVWLLYIGRDRRWALYLSMVFFALTPYAYGVATFITPTLLLLSAVHYLARRRAKLLDILVCILIFLAIAGPYFMTLAIQAMDWETMMIGPFTLPRFEHTVRQNDISLFRGNAYETILRSFLAFMQQFLVNDYGAGYNAIPWAHTMYPFTFMLYLSGLYIWWRCARRQAKRPVGEREAKAEDLFRLTLFWLIGAMVNGAMVEGMVNRQNAVFYPLILLTAYGIIAAGRRLRLPGAGLLALLFISFGCHCGTYFGDTAYQKAVADFFHDGRQQALTATWKWDYDHYYVFDTPLTDLMFAHQIDYAELSEERDLPDMNGNPSGWYFGDRYRVMDKDDTLELNPLDCAVYIFPETMRDQFDPADYEITEYGQYCAAYPRYWLE